MKIINLTQHLATPEQLAAGVVDLPPGLLAEARKIMTFHELPPPTELYERADALVDLVHRYNDGAPVMAHAVMIGGSPFFMAPLHIAILEAGFRPLYAFSRRESVEETLPDGSVKKISVFRHAGFVELS